MNNPIMPVYAPAHITPVSGKGSWLFEADGTAWLDCVGGVATNALGHCQPALVEAITDQAGKLWHISNGMRIEGQQVLAQKLVDASFADCVFFANTGTEAVEAAIKVARRHHAASGNSERVDIIGFHGSFHGRTYGALNASGNPAYLDGFGPAMPGFRHLWLDDEAGIAEAIAAPTTAAVIVEPVQGEGGANALSEATLRRLRQLCSQHGVLLIYDEVQCGMGRTGRMFAHQWFDGCEPDIMALAKALGSGFPVSACLATSAAASGMKPGTHGSTYGGNPLAMAVANAAFDVIAGEQLLANARERSAQLRNGLQKLVQTYPQIIRDVRGKGMLVGIGLTPNNREFVVNAREEHLLLAAGGDNIVRLLPALNMSAEEASEVLTRFGATCERMAHAMIASQSEEVPA